MLLHPTRYSPGFCRVEFARYANGQTAIRAFDPDGQPALTLTVNLDGHNAPDPGPDQVWLKTWSENAGVERAAVDGGIVTLTDVTFHCGHDAHARLANLTPAALLERDAARRA